MYKIIIRVKGLGFITQSYNTKHRANWHYLTAIKQARKAKAKTSIYYCNGDGIEDAWWLLPTNPSHCHT